MTRQLKLMDRVTFAGFQKVPLPWVAAMDILVLASAKEGLPRGILEAMLLGKPVIASDVVGSRELVRPELTGLLYPYGDVDALAQHLQRLLESADERRRFGEGRPGGGAERIRHRELRRRRGGDPGRRLPGRMIYALLTLFVVAAAALAGRPRQSVRAKARAGDPDGQDRRPALFDARLQGAEALLSPRRSPRPCQPGGRCRCWNSTRTWTGCCRPAPPEFKGLAGKLGLVRRLRAERYDAVVMPQRGRGLRSLQPVGADSRAPRGAAQLLRPRLPPGVPPVERGRAAPG
ncbi:MAG: glycosyltransferase [Comamonadaceae bacterium]|nr:glycosyltransferase [Comamonadaceae bacterium]